MIADEFASLIIGPANPSQLIHVPRFSQECDPAIKRVHIDDRLADQSDFGRFAGNGFDAQMIQVAPTV
ncbi:hypothetical protein D1872_213790 [compost metagenome]